MKKTFFIFFVSFLLANHLYAYDNDTTSSVLVTNAAEALKKGDMRAVKFYTQKCISLYKSHAIQMQKQLKDFAPIDTAIEYWALNDVAYAYFLQGEMYYEMGKLELAKRRYETVLKRFKFAQIYDPNIGGDWKVAEACESKLSIIDIELEEKTDNSLPKLKSPDELKRRN